MGSPFKLLVCSRHHLYKVHYAVCPATLLPRISCRCIDGVGHLPSLQATVCGVISPSAEPANNDARRRFNAAHSQGRGVYDFVCVVLYVNSLARPREQTASDASSNACGWYVSLWHWVI